MLSSLPDRPLTHPEISSLAQSDAIGFTFPATPNSIREDADGNPRIYDLVILIEDVSFGIVYDEEDGWKTVIKTDADRSNQTAISTIIEYRDYDLDDEEAVGHIGELIGMVSATIEREIEEST